MARGTLRLNDDAWKVPAATPDDLETIIAKQSTALPISFLEAGLLRANAVARVESPSGLGTGFLIQNNLLITNNHVISNPMEARAAKVSFNFQKTATADDARVAEYLLDPDATFATSPMDDWTAVRVTGNPNIDCGMLELTDLAVKATDYVSVIQHPGGMPKQITLSHSVVTFADDHRVQYLTSSMPGSSGSPVFDSNWRVVALHQSSGWFPEREKSSRVYFRNEGIHVRVLLEGLRRHGLLGSETDTADIEDTSFPNPGSKEWEAMNRRRAELIRKKIRGTLSPEELPEYERLQRLSRAALEHAFPAPTVGDEEIAQIEGRLKTTPPGESLK
jgi:V8-like Glu-specific endopeptidase